MEPQQPDSIRRFFNLPVLSLILAIALAGGAVFFLQAQRPSKTAALSVYDARLQGLENTVYQQEKRLSQLEQNIQKQSAAAPSTAPQPSAPPLPAQAPEVANSLEQNSRLEALEKEIAALKSASALADKEKLYHSIRLLSAFHRLSGKVLSGKPFASELSEFEDLCGDDAAIAKQLAALSPYADSGVPTFAVLLSTFDEAMDSLKADEASPPAGATLWQRIVHNFTHLITVRRIDEAQKGNSVSSILGRAEAHLDVQETAQAANEITSLPDDARSHFTSWLEDAQMSVQAPALMDQIEEDVLQKAFYTSDAADNAAPAATPSAPPESTPKSE